MTLKNSFPTNMLEAFSRQPLSYRKGIPFYLAKSALEMKNDKYEQFYEVVQKNALIHAADTYWGRYLHRPVLDWILRNVESLEPKNILDAGCGIGRITAEISEIFTDAQVFGLDYSYQMLKFANDYWNLEKGFEISLKNKGFPEIEICSNFGKKNINFFLAKAEDMPFKNNSIDLIVSSFLFDRLEDPELFIHETHRILEEQGSLVLISPLNFQNASQWALFYPIEKLLDILKRLGFRILDFSSDLEIIEPIDFHGNSVKYKVIAIHAVKKC